MQALRVRLSLASLCALAVAGSGLGLAARADGRGPTITSYYQLRLTDPTNGDTYGSIRRLKMMVQGQLDKRTRYYGQVLYKANNRSRTDGQPYLQELRVWRRLGRTRITVGQIKPPFGWERFTPDTELVLIDRAQVTNRLVPDGNLGRAFARDRGLQWDWSLGSGTYSLGLFDGAGANNDPHGLGPLVAARAVYDRRPGSRGRSLGAHAEAAVSWRYARDLDFTSQVPGSESFGYDHFTGHDWRVDLAAGLQGPRWEARAEYLRADYRPLGSALPEVAADGYYAQASYLLTTKLELAVKHEVYDPGGEVASRHHVHQTGFGLNFYIRGNREKLQINYLAAGADADPQPGDAWACQYQRFF